jgi:hypothetical protein
MWLTLTVLFGIAAYLAVISFDTLIPALILVTLATLCVVIQLSLWRRR